MMKAIVKLFLPSGKTLAGYAADGIQKNVNALGATTKERVEKYAMYAAKATEIANTLSKMGEDGEIDKAERDKLAALLEPLFVRLLELV